MAVRVKEVNTTTYLVVPEDDNYLIKFTSSTPVVVSVDENLLAGFSCLLVQQNTGAVSVEASGSGQVLNDVTPITRSRGAYMSIVAEADGSLRVKGEESISITLVQHNFNALTAPTTSDDASSGYSVGSQWIHTGNMYICVDNTTSSAVWSQVTLV